MRYKLQNSRRLILCALGASVLVWIAGPSVLSQNAPKPTTPASQVAPEEQFYRNTTFGFRYRIPFGWVDRTKEMREQAAEKAASEDKAGAKEDLAAPAEAESSSSNRKASSRGRTAKKKATGAPSEVLLAVFERPPAAAGDTINSAVVIASESASDYPGLKNAEDFLGPLNDLAAAQGFKAEGDPSGLTIDGRELVRADFTQQLTEKLFMRQSTLVLVAKGEIITFTFIAGSEDELDDLIENLGFAGARTK